MWVIYTLRVINGQQYGEQNLSCNLEPNVNLFLQTTDNNNRQQKQQTKKKDNNRQKGIKWSLCVFPAKAGNTKKSVYCKYLLAYIDDIDHIIDGDTGLSNVGW